MLKKEHSIIKILQIVQLLNFNIQKTCDTKSFKIDEDENS